MKKIFLIIFALSAIFTACDHDRNDTGRAYMADFDMYYSEAYESYSDNPILANGMTMQEPVEGTISREMIPYPYTRDYESQMKAAQELHNPIAKSSDNLKEGKRLYNIYCKVCHGASGQGDGHLYTAKLFSAKPSNFHDAAQKSKSEGEIFHIMTVGSLSGLMPSHASQIRPDDRWKIASYIKETFQK